MAFLSEIVNRWFLHLDATLLAFASQMPGQMLFIFFLIIFLETGLVVTPFLPGDSFLFAAGTLAATGAIHHPAIAFAVLLFAAILGNTVNFFIGHRFGHWVLNHPFLLIKPKHIQKTELFFQKYGAAAVIVSRFFPIVRTITPFLAGMGSMKFWQFSAYNVIGGVLWITSFYWGGYWLGNIPFVKNHFTEVVVVVIVVSLLPAIYHLIRQWIRKPKGLDPHN